ncbi:hypothetical protein GWO43_00370 [candidate division KSB1 bacterium]|nr:hypothetical protein [candidate division KSB1 bacterium]NIR68358.1 hypothetical protein [candidate division KSB1 bacterium]NIS22543.1 hypothetical protein [candidate division KSB1 bacterium]NIT69379.1 hypothetical protein [candidate division KSB1 bacterium]NIU23040.1 hypothetical protein [candidate division KSB1 bacterium]
MKSASFYLVVVMAVSTSIGVFPAEAQFAFEKLEEYSGFEWEDPVQFFWNPRYNRVEGLFLNQGVKFYPEAIQNFELYGWLGGGFWNDSNKQFRYTAGFRKDFFDIERLSIGAEVFKKVESEDDWIVGEVENSLAAFFFREDYKDYYGTQGFKFFAEHLFKGIHTLRFEVGRRTFDAFERNIDWSVFGGDFDTNPKRADSFIAEGDEIGLKFITAFDWRDNPIFPLTGWYAEAIFEKTFEDFDTDGLFVTVKRFQQTFGNQRFFVRTMLGTRRGDIGTSMIGTPVDSLADQYSIDLGGIGSLRGFDDKEFSGNRMFMLNFNYFFGGDILQKIPLDEVPGFSFFWPTLSLGVFLDTGWAWITDPDDGLLDGFGELTFDNLETDIGLSFLVLEGVFRIDIAKRTDRSEDDFRVTFRLLENF